MPRSTGKLLFAASSILFAPNAVRAQDLPESSAQALMHHAQGVAAYLNGDTSAIMHFRMAIQADPTAYASMLMAGVAAGNAGQTARADSFYAMVAPHKDKLSAYYRYRLEAQMASRTGDIAAYNELNRKAAALGPGTKAHYNVAQGIVQQGRAVEALTSLRQLDPSKEPMKGWWSYYTVYGSSAHAAGDFEDELANARRARAAYPDVRSARMEAEALAALGRVADAEAILATMSTMPAVGAITAGQATTEVAMELSAHGNDAASKRWLEAAVKWFEALPESEAQKSDNRFDHAYALYLLGRNKEAAALIQGLATEFPAVPGWKAWTGYLAALQGDRKTATDVSKRIESGEIRLTPSNSLIWRGLIATAMKDPATGVSLLKQSGVRARWMHRDPQVNAMLRGNAEWAAYLKPVG